MNADEAAQVLMRKFHNFAVHRTPQGYQFVLFKPTGESEPRHIKLSGINKPIEIKVPGSRPYIVAEAPSFGELGELLTRED